MAKLIFEDFESNEFAVITDNLGCFFIRKKCNETESNLFQTDALETYRELKAAYRKSVAIFHSLCNEYHYDDLFGKAVTKNATD